MLVGLFLVQIVAKVWIVISFKINQEYIAQYLCEKKNESITMCYGTCYLKKELKQTEEKNTQQLPTTLKLKFEILYFSESKMNLLLAQKLNINKDYNSYYSLIKNNSIQQGVFKPPQNLT